MVVGAFVLISGMRTERTLYVLEWSGIERTWLIRLLSARQRTFKIGCIVTVLMGLCSAKTFRKIIKTTRNVTYRSVFYFDRKNNHFDSFDCQDDESLIMFYSKKKKKLLLTSAW